MAKEPDHTVNERHKAYLSYQLYSARKFPPWDQGLAELAGIGFCWLEGFGDLYDDMDRLSPLLKQLGLNVPSGHFGLEMLENQPERVKEICRELGIKLIICPYLDSSKRPQDGKGYRALGARLSKIFVNYEDIGCQLAWHNHDFEFQPLPDGTLPIEQIFHGGGDILKWEADLAWIKHSGRDPLPFIHQFRDRIIAVHVKDLAPKGENLDQDGWCDIGQGVMDWPALFSALLDSSATYFILEHDNPADAMQFGRRGFAACQQMLTEAGWSLADG